MNRITAAAVAFALLSTISAPSMADDTGLASMHEWRRVGKLTCYASHTHYGSSAAMPSKRAAVAEAIKNWSGFTSWEYGSDWGNFAKAAAKKISCTQGASGWGCEIEARPCR